MGAQLYDRIELTSQQTQQQMPPQYPNRNLYET